ncbi:MAG: hypothetical protein SPI59_04875 [Finegoldia sp.]|nr:hypothetical protein [Finegoldia sp.]
MKKILQIILWQDFEKSSSRGAYIVSLLNWIIAIVFIIGFSVLISYSNLKIWLKILLFIYTIPSVLLWAPVKNISFVRDDYFINFFLWGPEAIFFSIFFTIYYLKKLKDEEEN